MTATITRTSKSGALAITGRMPPGADPAQFPTRAAGWERVTRDPGRVRVGCARMEFGAAENDAGGDDA